MGTKANPAPNDCYDNADDDEPIFTLRGKDPAAAEAVRYWAVLRVRCGVNRFSDEKIREAYAFADALDDWREANPDRAKWPPERLHLTTGPPVPWPQERPKDGE